MQLKKCQQTNQGPIKIWHLQCDVMQCSGSNSSTSSDNKGITAVETIHAHLPDYRLIGSQRPALRKISCDSNLKIICGHET
jgi:hypothetical protein